MSEFKITNKEVNSDKDAVYYFEMGFNQASENMNFAKKEERKNGFEAGKREGIKIGEENSWKRYYRNGYMDGFSDGYKAAKND